jgi:ABC transport system ATP-binding/permease protein
MCRLMGVARSTYYAWANRAETPAQARRRALAVEVAAEFEASRQTSGCRRIAAALNRRGIACSVELVADLMRGLGLAAVQPRAYKRTTLPGDASAPAPDLIERAFTTTEPGTRLVGDITYLRTGEGWLHLPNRMVAGWQSAAHMRTTLVTDALHSSGTSRNGHCRADFNLQEIGPVDARDVPSHLDGDRLAADTNESAISFRVTNLVVLTKNGRRLLDRVGFILEGHSLLAVVGPSGAGKSTLLGALTGFRPANTGTVDYAGYDLYQNYAELRERIGLVPQDDILHPQLTVRAALRYAAQLRLPAEATAAERERRIDEVLAQLGLDGTVAGQQISTLSGGQRKRTSLALELLTRPPLLFLDEPTTGLDPGHRKEVMQSLRDLADEGRTVITVTHDENSLDICDRLLVLAKGGRLAYFGPPSEALRYFGQEDYPDMFLLLDRDEHTDWSARFARSPEAARYLALAGSSQQPPAQLPTARPRQRSSLSQFRVLCRRNLSVIGADRQYMAFLLAMPLVLSMFAQILPGEAGLSWMRKAASPTSPGAPQQLLLVLIVSGAFAGFAGAFRELVKERAIYRRERAFGLSRGAYLGSKLVVLGGIAAIQGLVLGLLGTMAKPGPDNPVLLGSGRAEVVVALVAVTVAMMALGLLVSAVIGNADRGMPLLVVALMLQLVLCGGLFPVHDRQLLAELSWLVPARWAFAMGAATGQYPPPGTPPPSARPPVHSDPLWEHTAGTWLIDLVALTALTALFVLGAAIALRRLEPHRD